MNMCLYCGKEIIPKNKTSKAKYESNRKKFCSRSCAASYNNSRRNYSKHHCVDCNTKVCSGTKRCIRCFKLYKLKIQENRTLASIKSDGNARIAWGLLRTNANKKMELNNVEKVCKICGISEPVDCCHIKPISSFSLNTKVCVVNSLDNLVYLCKNHHWLFDNNKITL